jgi:hypothetical protein
MNDDFIGIYDGALTPGQCGHILQPCRRRGRFKRHEKRHRGVAGMAFA